MDVDALIGRMTEEETEYVARECLNVLVLEKRVQAVLACFNQQEREELAAWLDEEDEEGSS